MTWQTSVVDKRIILGKVKKNPSVTDLNRSRTLSAQEHGCHWNCLTCSMMMSLLPAAGWMPKYKEALLTSKQRLQNWLDVTSWFSRKMIQSMQPMQQSFFFGQMGPKLECSWLVKSVTWPQSSWACISLAEDQTEGKCPPGLCSDVNGYTPCVPDPLKLERTQ